MPISARSAENKKFFRLALFLSLHILDKSRARGARCYTSKKGEFMSKERLYQLDQRLYCGLPASPWQAVENRTTGFIHILDAEG